MSPERALLGFAVSVFVFHQLPAFLGDRAAAGVDLVTPFAVIGFGAVVLAGLGARRDAIVVALVAGTMYVDGHGIHLAANSISNETAGTDVDELIEFWDEGFSHVEAVLGWFGLVASFCLAEATAPPRARASVSRGLLAVTALVLGWTFFTSTVEGRTWWLALAAAALFGVWAARSPRPILRTATAAFLLAALLIGVWAVWQGGVPEFSETGHI
jgi:hypothetical protein